MASTWLYILCSYDGYSRRYYVGMMQRLKRRINEHILGTGAKSTDSSMDCVVGAYKICDYEEYDYAAEDELTLQMMKLYRPSWVKGGSYTKHSYERTAPWEKHSSTDIADSLISRLQEQKMPVICECRIPVATLKTRNGTFCVCPRKSLYADWFLEDGLHEDVWMDPPCDFFQPLRTAKKADEPNYCKVCGRPCEHYSTCYAHRRK